MTGRIITLLWQCVAFIVFVLYFVVSVDADRTNEKIYINLSGNMPCFRRLNATHQIGCASKRGGNVGILHYVDSYVELTTLLPNVTNFPIVIAIRPRYFARVMLDAMKESGKVNGVLLLYPKNDTHFLEHFSPDQICPNVNYGLYRGQTKNLSCSVKWNPTGNNILFEDWGFPIFLMKEEKDFEDILFCYNKFNAPSSGKADKWPFCAAELRSNMLAAKDTKTCLRRSRLVTNLNPSVICDPLGDQNIWSTLLPTNKSNPLQNKSVIVVAAKIDAASEFDGFSPGAHSTVTGLVTLLAVAEALSKLSNNFTSSSLNVMFVLFNGESFDYVGSSRMVYDMGRGEFPVKLDDNVVDQPALFKVENIAHFIELSQLSQMAAKEASFIHLDQISNSNDDIKKENGKVVSELLSQAKFHNVNLKSIHVKQPLPPSSLQSFLRVKNISGLVIADHETNYTNIHYNSIADVWSVMNSSQHSGSTLQQYLAKIASTVAGTVYSLATDETKHITVEESRIYDFLLCYLNNSDCTLFKESVDPAKSESLPSNSFPLYVSVENHINILTTLTLRVLALVTGEKLTNTTKEECRADRNDQIFRYIWMKGPVKNENDTGGVCVKTTGNYSVAVSPAFDIDDYDFDSGLYSSWTESVWEATSVRIFVKPSSEWEYTVLGTGFFVCLLSFIVVWYINVNAANLFSHSQVGC